MASGKNEAKIKFTADTGEFNAQIKAANSALTELRSELRLNATQMKASGASVESLAESKRILQEQDAALAQKVQALTGKLEAAKSTWGENSTEAQRYATQLNNAKAQQENVRAALEKTSQAIEEQARAEQEAQSSYGKLSAEIGEQRTRVSQLERAYADAVLTYGETSRECQQLKTELSQASAGLRESESRMEQAESAARELSRGLDDAADSADDAGLSFGELASADFVSDMAQDLIGKLFELSEETQEYTAAQAKLTNAFEWSGRSAEQARAVYQNFLGLLGDSDQAAEAAQDMNNLADTGADIDTWYSIAAGTVSAFGDALPIENLIESANETVRTGQVTGGLADALNWTAVNAELLSKRLGSDHPKAMAAFNQSLSEGQSTEDAMNAALAACSDEQERQEILTSVLASQYSELGDGYLSASEDIDSARRASDDLLDSQARLAEEIRPFQTLLTNLAAGGIGFLADNMNVLIPIVTGLAAAFAILKGPMAISAIADRLASSLNFVKMGLAGISPPLLVAGVAIGALVAAFTWAYQNIEPFRQAVDQCVAQLRDALGPVLQQVAEYLSGVASQALTQLTEIVTAYVVPALQQFGDFVVNTVVPALSSMWGWFAENILPVLQQLWGYFTANILPVLTELASIIAGVVVVAVSELWKWFSSNILPVLWQLWSFVSSNILPIFSQLAGFITGTVVPAFSSLWNWFSSNILPVLSDLGSKVKWVMDRFGELASFVGGLHIEFPHFNLPHLKFSGSFSLIPPKVPKFWVEWYAKGGVMTRPTIFGAAGGSLLGGGEAGPEAIAPISVLQEYVAGAVAAANADGADEIVRAIRETGGRTTVLEVNGRRLAEATASDTDRVGGRRQVLADRGVAL